MTLISAPAVRPAPQQPPGETGGEPVAAAAAAVDRGAAAAAAVDQEAAVNRGAAEAALAARLRTLVSPLGGLVGGVRRVRGAPGSPDVPVFVAGLGDPVRVLTELRTWQASATRPLAGQVDGSAAALDPDRASWLCIVEGLERYAMNAYTADQFIWATGEELGDEAVDLDTVPRLSDRELAHPACFLRRPDRSAPIRWVRGLRLATGDPVWVPAVLTYLAFDFRSIGERFTMSISTGCAAHPDPLVAINKGLREVIERDAVALTWHQRLALPRIELDQVSPTLAEHLDRAASAWQELRFYDATTDVGVPTVYATQETPHHRNLRTVVMCSTELDPQDALCKIVREMTAVRIGLDRRGAPPENPDDCFHLEDGALYSGAPRHHGAFDFLRGGERTVALSGLAAYRFADPAAELRFLVNALARRGFEAYVVDITPDEAARVGITVVRVIVPGLQPLSFTAWGQFRGHPRLYQAPAAMGHPVHDEPDLNPYPQPFA